MSFFKNDPPWLETHLDVEPHPGVFLLCHRCGDATQIDFGSDEALAAEQFEEERARHRKCAKRGRTGPKFAKWRKEHQGVVT